MTVLGEESFAALRRQKKPAILLVWHGRILLPPYYFRKRGAMPLISPSEDGEIIARITGGWGYKVLRGSGSHSIIKAWLEMKKELEDGGEVIIVPDGPKGPNREMKMGAIKLAQKTGAYLIPFTFSASKKKLLSSWDKFMLLYPFGRIVVLFGEPMTVSHDITDDDLEKERRRVEKALVRLDERADRYFDNM